MKCFTRLLREDASPFALDVSPRATGLPDDLGSGNDTRWHPSVASLVYVSLICVGLARVCQSAARSAKIRRAPTHASHAQDPRTTTLCGVSPRYASCGEARTQRRLRNSSPSARAARIGGVGASVTPQLSPQRAPTLLPPPPRHAAGSVPLLPATSSHPAVAAPPRPPPSLAAPTRAAPRGGVELSSAPAPQSCARAAQELTSGTYACYYDEEPDPASTVVLYVLGHMVEGWGCDDVGRYLLQGSWDVGQALLLFWREYIPGTRNVAGAWLPSVNRGQTLECTLWARGAANGADLKGCWRIRGEPAYGTLRMEPVPRGTGPAVRFEATDDHICVVCVSAPIVTALRPCGHAVVCEGCAHVLSLCPVCRHQLDNT